MTYANYEYDILSAPIATVGADSRHWHQPSAPAIQQPRSCSWSMFIFFLFIFLLFPIFPLPSFFFLSFPFFLSILFFLTFTFSFLSFFLISFLCFVVCLLSVPTALGRQFSVDCLKVPTSQNYENDILSAPINNRRCR